MATPNLHNKDFSVLVSNTLDAMGKNLNMVKERLKFTRTMSDFLKSFEKLQLKTIISGSKGEGLTPWFENDFDVMVMGTDLICMENTRNFQDIRGKTMFQMDTEDTSPGYTRLRLVQLEQSVDMVVQLLSTSDTHGLYLSNENMHYFIKSRTKFVKWLPRSGPSNPMRLAGIDYDFVYAFPCHSPSILSTWLTRTRRHNWPHQDTVNKISTLDAHVVPVGFKGSYRSSEEWRICYTKAELELVRSFTDAQIKVYVLLKYLAKDVLKHEFDVMTSYLMKNVIFWVSELTPHAVFNAKPLIDMLVQSLRLLCMFIEAGFCPNYMIPRRNLFSGKLNAGLRRKLLSRTKELIDDGGSMLLRSERLGLALSRMYKTPKAMTTECQVIKDNERNVYSIFSVTTGMQFEEVMFLSVKAVQLYNQSKNMMEKSAKTIVEMFSYISKDSGEMPQNMHSELIARVGPGVLKGISQGKDVMEIFNEIFPATISFLCQQCPNVLD